jgi:hypothetical protein
MTGEAKRGAQESELKGAARRHAAQGSGRALWRPCSALRRTAAGGGLEDKTPEEEAPMIIPNPHGLIRRVVKSLGVFRLEIADAAERNNERAPADAFRSEMARAEEWDIFDCGVRDDGTPHVELQRVGSPAVGTSRFDTDHAAWEHVVRRAREGSVLHVQALQLVDAIERKLIQAFCGLPDLPPAG